MGTFITSPTTPDLFDDKTPAPGLTRRPGWTEDNTLQADDANAIKNALLDCRTAIRTGYGSAPTVFVFGAGTVNSTEDCLLPGYGATSSAVRVGVPLPFDGLLTAIHVVADSPGMDVVLNILVDGSSADTLDFSSLANASKVLDQSVTAGAVIAIAIEYQGAPPSGVMVSLAVQADGDA